MAVTAAMVKELRERTGAGMMECKKALVETQGDMDAAVETLRKSGLAQADKKAGRVAAEGRIALAVSDDGRQAVMVEVNCETDFVAKDENFRSFADAVAGRALNSGAADVEALMALPLHEGEDTTIEEARQARKLNRRLFPVRQEQLHHRIASEIVSGRKRAKGYSDELVGGMQGAEVSHETTWNPIALSPITV